MGHEVTREYLFELFIIGQCKDTVATLHPLTIVTPGDWIYFAFSFSLCSWQCWIREFFFSFFTCTVSWCELEYRLIS